MGNSLGEGGDASVWNSRLPADACACGRRQILRPFDRSRSDSFGVKDDVDAFF